MPKSVKAKAAPAEVKPTKAPTKPKPAKTSKKRTKPAVVPEPPAKVAEVAPANPENVQLGLHYSPQEASEPRADGLVEVPVPNTPYSTLSAPPGTDPKDLTVEQRVAIAERLNEVGPKLPRMPTKGWTRNSVARPTGSMIPPELANKMKTIHDGAFVVIRKHAAKAVKEKAEEVRKNPPAKTTKKQAKPAAAKIAGSSRIKEKPEAVPKGGYTKANLPKTSGKLICARIMEHKLTDDAIAAEVRKLWPGRSTGAGDVRWNRSQLLKAGVKAPDPV